MQRGGQAHFFERALYYTSFPVMKQGRKEIEKEKRHGFRWDFSLDGVFFLGVLNFRYVDDGLTEHRYRLREVTTGEVMTDKLEFVFVEVPKFDKGEDELETDLDRWLYLLKNLSGLLERPAALRDRIFKRIFDVAEFAGLDDDDKKKYVKDMNTERDTYNHIAYAREEGLQKGREEGREEGRGEGLIEGLQKGLQKGREDIARKMLAKGADAAAVAELTELDIDIVRKLELEKTCAARKM